MPYKLTILKPIWFYLLLETMVYPLLNTPFYLNLIMHYATLTLMENNIYWMPVINLQSLACSLSIP